MQMISLSSIYDNISAHDHTSVRSTKNRYSAALEERPMYSKTPFQYVTGDKSQKSYGRQILEVSENSDSIGGCQYRVEKRTGDG